jgi:hypothetical protein
VSTPATTGTFVLTQGDTGRPLLSTLYDGNPSVVPLTTPGTTVVFQMAPVDGGSLKVNAPATITSPPGGGVAYQWIPADVDTAGAWRGVFVVTVPGQGVETYPADGIDILITPNLSSSRGPQVGPCFPWTTADAVRSAVAGIDPLADMTEWIEAAGEVLYNLTGRQFKGLCRATIRPGHESCSCGGLCAAHACGWPFSGGFGLYGGSGGWLGGALAGPVNTLLCASEIDLGHEARLVESIKIDGVEIDPATWRLDPLGKLVRQPDASGNRLTWPCCQRVDLPSGQPGTFEIRYVYGQDPPASVVMAVNVLAGQFWLASNPGSAGQCKLPAHVQTMTRAGVTATFITDVSVILEKGYTGLPTVDAVIRSVNPDHLKRRARVISIDVDAHRRMTP